jgi:hypothetical protein
MITIPIKAEDAKTAEEQNEAIYEVISVREVSLSHIINQSLSLDG